MGQINDKCSCLSNENNCLKSNINFDFSKEDATNSDYGETNQFKPKSVKTHQHKQSKINKFQKDSIKLEQSLIITLPLKKQGRLIKIQLIQINFRGFLFRKRFITEIKKKLVQHTIELLNKLENKYKNEKITQADNSNPPYNKDEWKTFYEEETKLFDYNYGLVFDKRLKIFGDTAFYYGQVNLEGEMHGYGIYVEKNGVRKQGHWQNNNFTGWGRVINEKGIILEGYYINGSLTGKGVRISPNGRYEGDFVNGIRHGKGTDKTKDHIYTGEFHSDKKHGIGKINFLYTKEFYEGEFKDSAITGYGVYTWSNKDSYEGTLLNGRMHGKGLYKWLDGGEYYGDYINGLKEGRGRFKWADGKIFEGPFRKGKPHGVGKLFENNNIISEVEFEAGKIVSSSITSNSNNNSHLNVYSTRNSNKIKNSPLKIKKSFTSTTGNLNDEENL
jgi:hypothetical protein